MKRLHYSQADPKHYLTDFILKSPRAPAECQRHGFRNWDLMFYRCQRGCECPDVVETREKFLRKMTACGILRPDNAPT